MLKDNAVMVDRPNKPDMPASQSEAREFNFEK